MVRKRRILPVISILFLAIILAGCEKPEQIPHTPLSDPIIFIDAEKIPPTEPAPAPGPRVFVNGTQILQTTSDGAVSYALAEELFAALSGPEAGDVTLALDSGHLMVNGSEAALSAPVLEYADGAYVPLREVCGIAGVSVLWDEAENTVYCTRLPRDPVPKGIRVPVLMYHGVCDETWGGEELFLRPGDMEKHLIYLTENGYDPIFFEDLCRADAYDKPVMLTFDDGYVDNYTELFPLLQKYGVKATIFLATGFMDRDSRYLTTAQIREMADSGLVSFQSHTVSHPWLDTLSYEQQQLELEQSKIDVTRLSLREPCVLAYPSGRFNSDTLALAEESYRFALRSGGGLYTTGSSELKIPRFFIGRDTSIEVFRYMIKQ